MIAVAKYFLPYYTPLKGYCTLFTIEYQYRRFKDLCDVLKYHKDDFLLLFVLMCLTFDLTMLSNVNPHCMSLFE